MSALGRPAAALAAVLVLVTGGGLTGCAGNLPTAGETHDRMTMSDETPERRRARVRLELASAYYARGQLMVALDEVKQAIAADPTFGSAYNLRGLIYSNLAEPQLAEESFRRALQLNPRDADSMHNFGWHLCREQRYAEADQLFGQAMAEPRYRDVPRTLLAQGVCQGRAGQLEQAERTLTRAYEIDPRNPAAVLNLAEVLMRRGDFERARYYVRRVNGVPDLVTAESLWLAARIEFRMGNLQGADDFGKQLRARFPQSPEARQYERGRFNE